MWEVVSQVPIRILDFNSWIQIYHPNNIGIGDTNIFKFKSEQVFKKCLERQVSEGVAIHQSNAHMILNSKSEYHQPSVTRVTSTREVRDRGS